MNILHITHSLPRGPYPLLWNILDSFKAIPNSEIIEVYLYDKKPDNHKGCEIFLDLDRRTTSNKNATIKIAKAIGNAKVDIVVTQRYKPSIIGAIVAKKLKIPVYSIFHGLGEFNKLKRKIAAFLYLKKTTFITVSNEVKNDLIQTCHHAKHLNTKVVYNAISKSDLEKTLHTKEKAREILGIPEDKCTIGFMGRMVEKKGIDILLKAFKQLGPPENTIVILLGNGKLLEDLKSQVVDLDISDKVFFLGEYPSSSQYLKAFDLFVQPSNSEAFGLSAVEAIFSKTPIVASDAGGLPEVLGKDGLIFPAGRVTALAEKLNYLLNMSEDDRKLYAESLYKRASENFDLKFMQDCYRKVILNQEE